MQAATARRYKTWDGSWQSRPTGRAALYHAIQQSQVGLLTRLNSWSPLVCELLLWDQAT